MRPYEIDLFAWEYTPSRLERFLSVFRPSGDDVLDRSPLFKKKFVMVGWDAGKGCWLDYLSDLKYELYCGNVVERFAEGTLSFVNGLGVRTDDSLSAVLDRLQDETFELPGAQFARRASLRFGECLLLAGSLSDVYERILLDTLSGVKYLSA